MTGSMWPIKGKSRAKRLLWGAEQNQLSWTFMKMLREGNRTCRVYDINPYVEVYQFRDNLYAIFNQNNDHAGDVWMYLLIGGERAMVVDTGCGLGNQRGLIEQLLGGMPYVVVNTHLGPDHSFGNIQYDTVYCHEYEVDNIKGRVKPGMWDFLFDENGNNIWLDFPKEELPPYRDYELIGLPNHYVFDLGGGHEVELIWTGGHAAGHAMYLAKKDRLIFAGDDVCSDVIGCGPGPRAGMFYQEYGNIETYRDNLIGIVERLDEFDAIFPGHFMLDLESRLFLDILDTLNAILADPMGYDYCEEDTRADGTKVLRGYKYVRGFGTVGYNPITGVYRPR